MDDNLTTPESIVSNPKFERLARFSDDPTDIVNLIGKLTDVALKNDAEAAKERAKGNDQAIKAYTSAMDTRVKGASALTKYIADLGSNDARVRSAAIAGIANTTKAQIEAFTKIEKQESGNFHPWFERARGNALSSTGGVMGPSFWTGLVGGVIQDAEISRENINIPWFVNVVQSKIDHGEIGDWRKMREQLGEDEYAKLERLWATAEEAKRSQATTLHDLESLQQQAEGFARANAGATDAQFQVARSTLEPLVTQSIQSITQGKSVEQLKNDAEHFYSASKVEKLEATADKYNAVAMDLLESLGYAGKDGTSEGAFSVDRWAPWRGSLVNDPKFQTWARERGYNDLGRAQIDENGKVLSYVRGADDNKAIKAYGRALRLETLDAAGYDTKPVSLTTALPYASVRSGTITDLDGEAQTIVAVNRGGKQSLYTMTRDGAPVPLTDAADLGINTNEIAWDGEPTAYAEIKDIKDDAQVARAYAAHLKDGSGTAGEVEAPAPTEDWTVSFGTFKDSDGGLPHNIYAVSDGNSPTKHFSTDLVTGKLVPIEPRGDAKFAFTLHVAPSRVAEFTGKDNAHATLAARLAEIDTSPDPADDADTLFMADEEYAKVAPKLEAKDEAKPEAKAGPAAWTVIETDKTPASETFIGSDYGTTARDGERRIRTQGGDVRTVGEKDTVAPLKKEEEYTTTRLNEEDRLVNRAALKSDNEKAQEIARSNLSEPMSLGEAPNKAMGHPDQAPPKLDQDAVLSPEEIEALLPHEKVAYAARVKLAQQADVRNKQVDALPQAREGEIGDRTIQARKYLDAHAKLEERIIAAKAAVEAAAPDKRSALQATLTQYEDAADTLYDVLNTTFKDEVADIIKHAKKATHAEGISRPEGLTKLEAAKPAETEFARKTGEAQLDFKESQKPGTYDSSPVPKPALKGTFDHKVDGKLPPAREKTKEALARRGIMVAPKYEEAPIVRQSPPPAVLDTTRPLGGRAFKTALDGKFESEAPTSEKMAKDALRNAMKAKFVSPSMMTPTKEGIGVTKVAP